VGPENVEDLLHLREADILAHGKETEKLTLLEELRLRVDLLKGASVHGRRDLAVDGHRIMEILKLEPGPEVGKVVETLMEHVMEHPEWNTEERLLVLLRGIGDNG
jgi:hypothetical protein